METRDGPSGGPEDSSQHSRWLRWVALCQGADRQDYVDKDVVLSEILPAGGTVSSSYFEERGNSRGSHIIFEFDLTLFLYNYSFSMSFGCLKTKKEDFNT